MSPIWGSHHLKIFFLTKQDKSLSYNNKLKEEIVTNTEKYNDNIFESIKHTVDLKMRLIKL